METLVFILQEDAVAPATDFPPQNIGPAAASLQDWGLWDGGHWYGCKLMEQKCVRRNWSNHDRSPGWPAISQGPLQGWPQLCCRGGLAVLGGAGGLMVG